MKNQIIKQGVSFTMVDFSKPIIVNNAMVHDNKIGGILLKYKVKDVFYITLFKKNIIIYNKASLSVCAFFNPLKMYWRPTAYKISKIYWGKKYKLLTNYWLEVDPSFKSIHSLTLSDLKSIPHCKHKQLIKHLTSYQERFIMSNFKK